MSSPRPPQHGVPTLTEVVIWPDAPESASGTASTPDRPVPGASDVPEAAAAAPEPAQITQAQLTERVLLDLNRQIDLMLDYRLRETLTPLLARAADGLIRDARNELASTLRDVVARAVAQELSRHRIR